MKRVVTIAGAAAQGSAGIQADLKTFQERDVYGMAVITATVARHSKATKGIYIRSIEEIEDQFYTIQERVGFDAIKTGMLFSEEIIKKTVELIDSQSTSTLVVDPVMVGKMGSQLLQDSAITVLKNELIPKATVITPNRLEASKLLDREVIAEKSELIQAAIDLHKLGAKHVVLTGGVVGQEAIDVYYNGQESYVLRNEAIKTVNTSGAGCTFAACLTAELAKNTPVYEAVKISKDVVYQAIKHSLSFGEGVGSVRHGAYRQCNDG
ncbi:bifunctional hydroxymethylpyrimidine kinase/phosphomethylpyrimidine kinase [Gracilibacillus halotolerans]|nr:bifunctional hydroxymethylpyrimidine kinase/phosphomethylpyrimidine kinase [Gracilibacillus halotolerans]